ALIVIGLTVDLSQYLITTFLLDRQYQRKERELKEKVKSANPDIQSSERIKLVRVEEFTNPRRIGRVVTTLFWSKVIAIISAYVLLGIFLLHHVSWSFKD